MLMALHQSKSKYYQTFTYKNSKIRIDSLLVDVLDTTKKISPTMQVCTFSKEKHSDVCYMKGNSAYSA